MMKNKSIEFEDVEIISESLGDSSSKFINFIARQVDNLTGSNRGSWVTETMILSDLTHDKSELREVYKNNKMAIDSYFSQVDVEKIINLAGPDAVERIQYTLTDRAKNNVPGFLIGGITGAAITALVIQKNKQ